MISKPVPSYEVLGIRVNLTTIDEVVSIIDEWITMKDGCKFIIATGMHGVVEAQRNPYFKKVVTSAELFVPDGFSLIAIARLKGFKIRNRVSGPDLMFETCKNASKKGHKMFFYGDTANTLECLSNELLNAFPSLNIVGAHSPPFRPLTEEEALCDIEMINSSGADILWVGLGLPKQEQWIYEHQNSLNVPVAIGVGAAFRFLSGRSKRAPSWIGENGFEWLWRLILEPRRVWRRVLIDAPYFLYCLLKQGIDSRNSSDSK